MGKNIEQIQEKAWANQTELAIIVGVSQQRISALKKQGRIKETKRGYHVLTCKKIIEESRQSRSATLSLTEARTRHETAKANLAELEYRKRAGELVEISEMEKFMTEVITITRNRLLGVGARVAPLLVGLESAKKIKKIIDDEIYDALSELSKMKKENI